MGESMKQQINRTIKMALQRQTFHNHVLSQLAQDADYCKASFGKTITPYMKEMLDKFVPEQRQQEPEYMKALIADLRFSRAFYASSYREYFLFDFEKKSEKEKKDYVCWVELEDYYDKMNRLGNPELFENKHLTAQKFSQFFKRDTCTVRGLTDEKVFCSFLQQHGRCILKPLQEFGGKGIVILALTGEKTPKEIWRESIHRVPFLLEELIQQGEEIAKFNPSSVNTIRYNTFFHEGKLSRLQAVFRIGRGGSFVDNATSGGLYSLVDTETGTILNPARSFKGELFSHHPDTGLMLQGSTLPHWGELNELLERLARIVPEQKQVGWDLAFSNEGWVMVEANTKPALQRFDMSHGLRPLMKRTFGTAIRMWE